MIVVDTNVLIPFHLESADSEATRSLFHVDPYWYAPYLWRSEFRNAVATHMRVRKLTLHEARAAVHMAEEQMFDHERFVDRDAILDLLRNDPSSEVRDPAYRLAIRVLAAPTGPTLPQ